MTRARWATELASCLVGERVELPQTAADAHAVLAALEDAGWGSQVIAAIAYDRFAAEEPWPFPVSRDVVAAGPAQWYALVGQARTLLGLDGEVRPPSTRTSLSADERRLLTDVPPHW
jgi:hypothetical protein